MKEKELISSIKTILNSSYIGDDCAYLKDLEIVVTQDSLVEGVHFSLDYITPYQLGYKSIMVNASDIAASGAQLKYFTIALSIPSSVSKNFIEEFYKGAKEACPIGIEIVGGDITSSSKVFVSVCAIGSAAGRNISSRSGAKEGYKVVVCGMHGSSAIGLKLLSVDKQIENVYTKAHLEPSAKLNFGSGTGEIVKEEYAMMDTSDGLMDALSTIAYESGVLLDVDFEKIPRQSGIEEFQNWQDMVLFGGEDYGIVAVVPKKYEIGGTDIGTAYKGSGVNIKINGQNIHYTKQDVEKKIFNHFE